jgi:predicted  nucleic acid-binding Zn-ribbon protein
MEKKFLNKEELESLRNLQSEYTELINSLGTLEYQITLLQNSKKDIKQKIAEFEKKLEESNKTLVEKYGLDGQFDLETGAFVS